MKKKSTISLIAALMVIVLALSGCAGQSENVSNTTRPTSVWGYTYKAPEGDTNSGTAELIDDFSYILDYPFTYVPCDKETIKEQKYEDISTILFSFSGETFIDMYIYDAKRETIYYDMRPYNPDLLSYYKHMHKLSPAEKTALTALLYEVNTHQWEEYYPGKENDWVSYSGAIDIEYKTGVFEYHCGSYANKKFPKDFDRIRRLFESYIYTDNPTYARKGDDK